MAYDIRYAYLANIVYDASENYASTNIHFIDPTGGAWTLAYFHHSAETGYQGGVYVNADTKEIAVVHRGTEVTSSNDLANDLAMGLARLPAQYDEARKVVAMATTIAIELGTNPDDMVIIGHSLGGSLAELSGYETGLTTVTFNAYGVGNIVEAQNIPPAQTQNITNHVMHFDPVSELLGSKMLGQTISYLRQGEDFLLTAEGKLLSTLSPHILLRAIATSHSVGNFQNPDLAKQLGTAVTIDVFSASTILTRFWSDTDRAIARSVCTTFFGACTAPRSDPLTLDLDGDGIETTGINTATPVMFDISGTGVQQSVGWVGADDGFLVRDLNSNGLIDSRAELFGDATTLSNGAKATDGFAALADLDANHDGVVNASDAAFSQLRVWRDLDQDGITDAGELQTLSSLGIAGLNVASTSHSQMLTNGNELADLGTFIKADGQVGTLGQTADVNLAVDTFTSQFTDTLPANDHFWRKEA